MPEKLNEWITPIEAALIMSQRAGYKITPDDVKQLRRRGKIKAAKQLPRTTLYDRTEIDRAPIPKKRKPIKLPKQKEQPHPVLIGA